MKINSSQSAALRAPRSQSANAKASESKSEAKPGIVEDFFSYTPREPNYRTEGFLYTVGKDFVHSMPFMAKIGGVGAALGLGMSLAVGGAAVLPVLGGVVGVGLASHIADTATTARDMAHLGAIISR